jgi:hypothetical protein
VKRINLGMIGFNGIIGFNGLVGVKRINLGMIGFNGIIGFNGLAGVKRINLGMIGLHGLNENAIILKNDRECDWGWRQIIISHWQWRMIELFKKNVISRIIIEVPAPSSPIVLKNSSNKPADHELHH